MARGFHNVREKFMQLCQQLARRAFLQKQVTNARKPVAVAKQIAVTGFILSVTREDADKVALSSAEAPYGK